MSETTGTQEGALAPVTSRTGEGAFAAAWERLKLVVNRSVFWSYERGTWQYDVMVLVILLFILLTPRSWFRDQPTLQLTDLRHVQGVVELRGDKSVRRYMVDARLVESLAPLSRDEAIRQILQRRTQKPLEIKSINPVLDKNNIVLGYTVVVAP